MANDGKEGGERGCIEAWRTVAERVRKGSRKPARLERRRTWPGKSIERRVRRAYAPLENEGAKVSAIKSRL